MDALPTPPLYLVGNIARVTTIAPSGSRRTVLGGAGFNIAAAASVCHRPPILVSAVGNDLTPDDWRSLSLAGRAQHIFLASQQTCHFTFRYHSAGQEPEITSDYGAASSVTSHAVSLNYADSWLHISCRDPLRANLVIEHAVSQGLCGLSVDLMFSSLLHQLQSLAHLLRAVDYIFINALEFDLSLPTLTMRDYMGHIVVTDGARGSRVIKEGKIVAQAAAKQADNIVDQTGAGDVFIGAFLGSMCRSTGLSTTLERANEIASLKLTDCGVRALLAQLERSQAP